MKLFAYILACITIAFLFVLLLFIFLLKTNNVAFNKISSFFSNPKQKLKTQTLKTKTDTLYGFSFSYPPQTTIEKQKPQKSIAINSYQITTPQNQTLLLNVYKTNCNNECFEKEIINWWPKTKLEGKEITINGIKGYQIDFDEQQTQSVRREIYLLNQKGLVIYFVISNLDSPSSSIPKTQQQIINSFRFSK